MTRPDLDHILLQLGQFGRFQLVNYIAISFPILFSAVFTLTYIFTTQDLEYRCRVPECESVPSVYEPEWLKHAVPFHGDKPSECERYARLNVPLNGSRNCPAELFSTSEVVQCQEWEFKPGQRNTIVNEWNITCHENKWQLSIVGTINNIGLFMGLPFAGYISDRYGRKRLLFWSWLLTCTMGFIRSFATNLMFLISFEFLDAFFGAGVFSAGFILAMEFVGPEKRVAAGTLLNIFYAAGQVLLGAVAWGVTDWRWMLRAIYLPAYLSLLLLWPAPESVRWLASKGRYAEADDIIRKAAKFNKVVITEGFEDRVDLVQVIADDSEKPKEKEKEKLKEGEDPKSCMTKTGTAANLLATFKSRTLVLRFINCCYCWMANTFVYYGLSLNSVAMAGNVYLNFILVSLVEMPAILFQMWLMERIGRRACLCLSLVVAGGSCLAFLVIPNNYAWLQLFMSLVGKFGISISFSVIYVFTAELFPTNVRHSLIGACSMFGRIGSMMAPQTPLLAGYMESLPLIMFGVSSLVAAALALFFPETRNKPLPDSIKEAEQIGS